MKIGVIRLVITINTKAAIIDTRKEKAIIILSDLEQNQLQKSKKSIFQKSNKN